MAKAKTATTDTKDTIVLRRLEQVSLTIPIIGMTPVIPHRWSEKARKMLPGHPERDTVKTTKGVHVPEEEAEACLYKIGNKLAMPATAFKAAMVGACRFFEKPAMVEAKIMIHVVGQGPEQLVPIKGRKELKEDIPRINNGKSVALAYRYYIHDWSAEVEVRFIPEVISSDSIVALLDAAGHGGIGDWRPSAPKSMTGTYGTWRVDMDRINKEAVA